jgi:hypothetical protein
MSRHVHRTTLLRMTVVKAKILEKFEMHCVFGDCGSDT